MTGGLSGNARAQGLAHTGNLLEIDDFAVRYGKVEA